MTTEQYSIGYDEGYQDGWNAAMEAKPARKPLTNEEMEKIAAEYWLYPRKFVRAIEAAHGIKENT